MDTFSLARMLVGTWCCLSYSFGGDCVYEKGGDIFVKGEFGKIVTLTSTGRDFDPSITDRVVVFCRRDSNDEFRSSVYAINLPAGSEKLIFSGPVKYRGGRIDDLALPQIDETTQTLFFLARGAVTTAELFRVDLKTNMAAWVASAAYYLLIRSGPHAGDLLVNQREHTASGDISYAWWYYSRAGKRLGFAGTDRLRVNSLVCTQPEQSKDQR
jgi:hypothetical protein